MNEIGDAEYEHDGRTWTLPADLVAHQIGLARADAACHAAVTAHDDTALAEARSERQRLVVEKFRLAKPWWDTFENYDRWRADWALQAYARTRL